MERKNTKENHQKLFEIAQSQLGLFTTKQAEEAGFRKSNHSYHVQTGNWVREYRGIYQLKQFPFSEFSQYMIWYLWTRDRNEVPHGVFSHVTALSLYELSDANPAKIHMTVPKGFRRKAGIPEVLTLHYDAIAKQDTREMHGFRVTTPLRTLSDLIKAKEVSEDIIRQAADEAVQRGLITIPEIKSADSEIRKVLEKSLKGAA